MNQENNTTALDPALVGKQMDEAIRKRTLSKIINKDTKEETEPVIKIALTQDQMDRRSELVMNFLNIQINPRANG